MGRWAQAQRRGTVSPGETVAGRSPPVYGVDWDVSDESAGSFEGEGLTAGSGFILINMTTTEHPLSTSQGFGASPGTIAVGGNDGVVGNHYSATAQWANAGMSPVSALSTPHTGILT